MHGFLPVWITWTSFTTCFGTQLWKGMWKCRRNTRRRHNIGKTESGTVKALYVFQLQKLHQMSNIQRIQKTHQESSLPLEFCLKPQRKIQIIILSSSFVFFFFFFFFFFIIIIIIIFTIIFQCVSSSYQYIYIYIYIYIHNYIGIYWYASSSTTTTRNPTCESPRSCSKFWKTFGAFQVNGGTHRWKSLKDIW